MSREPSTRAASSREPSTRTGPAARHRARPAEVAEPVAHHNEVELVGRVAEAPVESELPSGDVVASLRLVVERGARERRPPTVDTVDCAVWTAGLRRRVVAWQAGDTVAVTGRLRRRFWRGPTGPVSRYEVEVVQARRVSGSSGGRPSRGAGAA